MYILMGSLANLTGITNIQGYTNQCEWLFFHSLLMALCDHFQGVCVKKQPSQDVLQGDAAEEELGLC